MKKIAPLNESANVEQKYQHFLQALPCGFKWYNLSLSAPIANN